MLDAFEIVSTSGIVLWRRHYAPGLSPTLINNLINDVFIEERLKDKDKDRETYRSEKHTLRFTTAKDVGLIFVAVYQSLLHLSWVENLLAAVRALFVKQYGAALSQATPARVDTRDFDQTFDALVRKLDTGSTRQTTTTAASEHDSESQIELTPPSSSASVASDDAPPPPPPPASQFLKPHRRDGLGDDSTGADTTPIATPETSRPTTPARNAASHLLTGKPAPGKMSRRGRKAGHAALNSAPASSGDEAPKRSAGKKDNSKQKRRWDADGQAVEGEDEVLDYSAAATPADEKTELDVDVDAVRPDNMGRRTGKGQFVLKDLEDEVDAILAQNRQTTTLAQDSDGGLLNTATSKISGLFRNVVGGKKLTKQDLAPALLQMRNHLLEKNIAREAAERLCASVETDLLNSTTASFTSIDATIRSSMSRALTRILTPTSSLDLLRNITTTVEGSNPRPYVISIVGVNGVGKSTNLSKIAYFLLQNKFRVLVVAADTFRSGAVEQLRVHVRNLTELARRENVGHVELFEKGYGKDAATVARDAVSYASNGGKDMLFDVVLIDTAGRRHNDTRLMSSLTKFGQLANPDKIFMVGEALVGTDSVAQARNFAKEFVDSRGVMRNGGVGMDGFIISKCDTVGDMVGTLVSMVHATGIPVVFLGVGQHYGDLRGLNVQWAVGKLMS